MPSEDFATLALNIHFWIPIVAIALIGVAVYAYFRTTPEVHGRLRQLLVALRVASFLLLVLILTDPRWVRTVTREEPPRVVALVDNSVSMGFPAGAWDDKDGETRFAQGRRLADEVRKAAEDQGADVDVVMFSNELVADSDTVTASGQGTDIVGALQKIVTRYEGEHLSAVVLLSDGIETSSRLVRGAVPAVPVYAVGLGDTTAPEDVRIVEVDYPAVVRVPARATIAATLAFTGDERRRVSVRLIEDGKTVFENDTLFTPDAGEIVQNIPVRFREPGRRSFKLDVEVLGNDAEPDNNTRDIVIEAEKAKSKVVIVDLTPGWELHFLTDFLTRDQTFDFDVITMPGRQVSAGGEERVKQPADFLQTLPGADAVVLVSLTEQFFAPDVVAGLTTFVNERGGGLLIMPGDASLYEMPGAWQQMDDLLPLRGTPPFRFNLQYTSLLPGAQAGANPITSNLLPVFSQSEWQERSPLLGFYGAIAPKNVSEVLLSVKGRSLPAFTYQTVGKGRTAAVSAGPLWRWKFLSDGNTVYDEMLSRLLDVLSRGEETDRFVLSVPKNVYEAGESAEFFAEIYNEKMQPITGVPVRVEVSRVGADGEETPLQQLAMRREDTQSTRYTTKLNPLPPGNYVVRGSSDLGDRVVSSKPVEIRVSRTSVEFARVNQNQSALNSIARRSGGGYVPPASIVSVVNNLDLQPRNVPTVSETTFRTSLMLFLLILALLSAEWMLRKRAGMI